MAQYPIVGGGTPVDDQFLSDMLDNYTIKPADATPRVAATLVNDTDLTFPVVANAVYDVLFNVRWAGLLAAGLRTAWSVPSGTTGNRECMGPGSANAASGDANTTELRWAVHGYATAVLYTNPRNSVSLQTQTWEQAILSVGSTAGSCTFQWGQNVANATGSLVVANSYVKYRRIG
jgi:hypothetical protein